MCRDRDSQNSETNTESKEESGQENDSVNVDKSQQQTGSSTEGLQSLDEEKETGPGVKDDSQTPSPTSDGHEQDIMNSKQEDRQTPMCSRREPKMTVNEKRTDQK